MKAGRLRDRIKIQKRESYRDPQTGQQLWRVVGIATVWAEVKGISGRELVTSGAFNGQLKSAATLRIWMRYRSDVDYDCTILHQMPGVRGNEYGIKAIIPDAKRTRLELLCQGGIK